MTPKQISIFDADESPIAQTPYANRRLFSDHVLEREAREWREWRRAPLPAGLRDAVAVSIKTGSPRKALETLGFVFRDQKGYLLLFSRTAKSKPCLAVLMEPEEDPGAACRLLCAMRAEGARWGMLANGGVWRLFRADLPGTGNRWFEMDARAIADGVDEEPLRTFAMLFGATPYSKRETVADAVHRAGRMRAAALRDSLRDSLRRAAVSLCRGFICAEKLTTGAVPTDHALEMIYKHSLVVIHRLLFLFYAEATGVLPGDGESYRSTCGLCGIAGRADELKQLKKNRNALKYKLWDSLTRLMECVHHGDDDLHAPCLGGELTDPDTHPFLALNRVPDAYMAEAIELLALKGGRFGRPGDGYAELDAMDMIEAAAPLASMRPRFAAEPMALVRERGAARWLAKRDARWKETLETADKGEIYLEECPECGSRAVAREAWLEYAAAAFDTPDSGAGYIMVPESGAGAAAIAAIDFAARRWFSAPGRGPGSFTDALRDTARRTFALDTNPLNVDLVKLGIRLLTLGDEPPLYLDHNVRAGNALTGMLPGDVSKLAGGDTPREPELRQLSHELRQAWSRLRPGLAGVRARESGIRKVDRRTSRWAALPEVWTVAGRRDDPAAESEPPLVGHSQNVVHPPIQFPEVFFSEERFTGFEAVLAAPVSRRRLFKGEAEFLKRTLGMRGTVSAHAAAAKRFVALTAPGGTLALLAPKKFIDTSRAKKIFAEFNATADIDGTTTRKLPGGLALVLIRRK